jgi:serine/threonine protein phosphatase PrpC
MIESYSFSCQGESHKADNKPCQDASFHAVYENGLAIAVVCDGHGGERYFRSDVGSRMATEVILDTVRTFVENIDKNLFISKPFTAQEAITSEEVVKKQTPIDVAFRQLFSSIIYQWNQKIAEHAANTTISEWEQQHVDPKYINELSTSETFEKIYGCTLMAYAQTSDYWFAFHLGDGKCISFQEDPLWMEPIPWDDRCFLNKTTSICDSGAINEFRYCYQGDGHFPMAVFLGSDGIDDSFGEIENLVNFYIQVIKMLVNDGREETVKSIEKELPQLSAIGSKDDMSVAFIYNLNALQTHIVEFIQYQIKLVTDKVQTTDKRIKQLTQKLDYLEDAGTDNEKDKIEAAYARQDIERANEERNKLLFKHEALMQQLSLSLSKELHKNGEAK